MLEWLKDLVRPIRLEDPGFGPVRHFRDAKFWEGKTPFPPLGREVEVLIHGPEAGPSDAQRVFYKEVQDRYAALWPELERMLKAEAMEIEESHRARFCLLSVNVPAAPGQAVEWELSYETEPPSWHYTVTLQGWKPRAVLAEC